jgi:hypothetical protein
MTDLPNVAMLIVRAGRDQMPGLNVSIDQFVAKALELNLPVTVALSRWSALV